MSVPESQKLLAPQETHWIPLADLMTGLMMIFLLISIVYMVKVEADASQLKHIATDYSALRVQLYQDLRTEFAADLQKWGAEIDPDMTIRFKEPDVLFDTGSDNLKPRFKAILDDFFPRYIRILTSEKYRNSIKEVRIEGHTSSFWANATSEQDAYFKNMALSQARTRSVLEYVMGLSTVSQDLPWLRSYVTANGLSSAKPIKNPDGTEDVARSQRVEFRVRTDASARIAKMLEAAQQ
jgi:outer membrane protein OmpA-like peptidoglycan-associated protein